MADIAGLYQILMTILALPKDKKFRAHDLRSLKKFLLPCVKGALTFQSIGSRNDSMYFALIFEYTALVSWRKL